MFFWSAVLNSGREPVECNAPLMVGCLIVSLSMIVAGVWLIPDNISELMDGIATEALEVNFAPGIAFVVFAMITAIGLAVTAIIQLFKIKVPAYALAFIINTLIFGGLVGFSARIVSPYAVGYYLESIGYTFCEYRTARGFREITELSWVRYASMCEDGVDLTGLTEAKLQEYLRTEEGALEKAEALGIFLK